MDGKMLGKAMDTLDEAAKDLKVRPLSDFYSVSRKQALADLGGEDLPGEEFEALTDDHVWWPASLGLTSVGALIVWATRNPQQFRLPEAVIADLQHAYTLLEAAAREGVDFNLAVSA